MVKSSGTCPRGPWSTSYGLRAVFNLKDSVKISSGEGTKENPYILEM